MKLGLGTVQFGLDYGVANPDGQVSPAEVRRILDLSAASGLELIDTAHLYGDSEQVLGDALRAGAAVKIVTKTPRFGETRITETHADWLEEAARLSLTRLRRSSLYGLLVHHAADALAPGSDRLFERLALLKERGLVEKIGVSVYGPDELELIMDRHPIDLVQLPFNLLDQRVALRGALLDRLRRQGTEVHVRSAFLQGLLLLSPDQLAPYFAPWLPVLREIHRRAGASGFSLLSLATRFVLEQPFVDVLVVGVNCSVQLSEIVEAARSVALLPSLTDVAVDDERLINPARWPPRRPAP